MNLFSRFFQENQEKFLAFAYSYLRDKAEAEDVVMESMIALWENRDRWRIRSRRSVVFPQPGAPRLRTEPDMGASAAIPG